MMFKCLKCGLEFEAMLYLKCPECGEKKEIKPKYPYPSEYLRVPLKDLHVKK